METRASYVTIGAFVLIVIIGALASLYWLYRASGTAATETVRIIFPEPVTGLSAGGSVLFNGIRIGEVVSLNFSPEGGDNVVAFVRIDPAAPVKTDTIAKLGFTGLTGVAYISLTGGSAAAPSLLEATTAGEIPTIVADTSAFTNVLDSAQSVLARMNQTLDEVNGLLRDNRDDVDAVVANVRNVTQALSDASPQISGLIDDVASAARSIASAVPQVSSAVARADTLLAAVEPARVTSIVANVDTFTASLPALSDQAGTILGNVNGVVTRLDQAASTVGEAVQAVANIVGSIDQEALGAIVENIRTATAVIAERSAAIGTTLDNAAVISTDVRAVTAVVASRQEAIATALDNATGLVSDIRGAVSAAVPAIENIGNAVAAVTPARITAVVDNVERFTSALAGQSEEIARFVTAATGAATSIDEVAQAIAARRAEIDTVLGDAAVIAANLRTASERLPGLVDALQPGIENISAVLSSIDAEAVGAIVTDARTLVSGLAAQTEPIGALIASARQVAADIEAVTAAVAQRTPEIEALIGEAGEAARAIASAARTVDGLVTDAAPAVRQLAEAVSVITPARVDDIVTRVQVIVNGLAGQAPAVEALIADARAVAASARTLATTLEERAPAIGAAIDDARVAAGDIRTAAAALPNLVTTLQPGVEAVAAALSAIDAEAVRAIVADVRTVTTELAAAAPRVQAIVARVDAASEDVLAITNRLRGELDGISAGLADAEAALRSARTFADGLPQLLTTVQPGAENLSAVLQAIDPAAIEGIITDVRSVTGSVSAVRGDITTIVTTAGNAAREIDRIATVVGERSEAIGAAIDNAGAFIANLAEVGPTVRQAVADVGTAAATIRETVANIDTTAVNGIIGNVQSAAAAIGSRSEEIGRAIDDAVAAARSLAEGLGTLNGEEGAVREVIDRARRIAANLEEASAKIGGVVDDASGLFDGPVQNLVTNVSGAAASVRDVAAAFASRADQIAGGFARFSSSGLDDLRSLIDQGRSTLSTIERAVSNFNRDPSRVIFGGSDGPRYAPQRR